MMAAVHFGRSGPALECVELSVRYGEFLAVDRVSIAVEAGEIYGLLGPNGAGKTSAIRALTTIVPLHSGRATIAGHDITDATGVRANIGVLPESAGYPRTQTARGYLRFYGQMYGLDPADADQRSDDLLRQFGLGSLDRPIATYSRGMRQRLGICRSTINFPAVLFLDEPTLGLDPAGRKDVLAQLARIAVEDGTAVVLCSHLLDEVERVCDRVGILHEGKLVADGTVDDVIASSGVRRTGLLRFDPSDLHAAARVLSAAPSTGRVEFDNSRPGDVLVEFPGSVGDRSAILRALLAADIEPRAFDLRGERLSDAFFALTESAVEASR